MLLCCRVLLQVSLLAVACSHCQRKKLSFSRGLTAAEVKAQRQTSNSAKFEFRKWNLEERKKCAVRYRYFNGKFGITRYLPKVPLSFVTINTLNTISEHCGCLFWDQGSSEWWVEAGCDQRSSQTAHPTSTLFLGVNRFIRNVFSIYVEKVWKLENTIPQLYSWGWTGL